MATSKQLEKSILALHENGLTNRQIGERLDCHHRTVSYWLKKNNLISNGNCRMPFDRVNPTHIRCSKCKEIKLDKEFLYNRHGKQYEYRFTYCLACRNKQSQDNLNSSVDKRLRDKYLRIKKKSQLLAIPFSITFKDFLLQYHKQKGRCFYTNEPMSLTLGKGLSRNACSVDKIIPQTGYVKNNVVFCTFRANSAKNDFSLDEIKQYMPMWYNKIVTNYDNF